MSESSFQSVVSSHNSKIVKTIIGMLGIQHLPVLEMTMHFKAQQIVTLAVDVAVPENLDADVAHQLRTLRFVLMEPTGQVTEQVESQEG